VQFSISELAKEFAITTRAIRFYEEKGLLKPQRVGNQRSYSAKDRVHLKLILRGKRLGMTLEEAAEIISLYDPTSNNQAQKALLLEQLQKRKALLEAQREYIDLALEELTDIEQKIIKEQISEI